MRSRRGFGIAGCNDNHPGKGEQQERHKPDDRFASRKRKYAGRIGGSERSIFLLFDEMKLALIAAARLERTGL
jgi:hypothetical protein